MIERTINSDTNDTLLSEAGGSKLQFKFFKNQEIPEFFYNLDTDSYMKSAHPKA